MPTGHSLRTPAVPRISSIYSAPDTVGNRFLLLQPKLHEVWCRRSRTLTEVRLQPRAPLLPANQRVAWQVPSLNFRTQNLNNKHDRSTHPGRCIRSMDSPWHWLILGLSTHCAPFVPSLNYRSSTAPRWGLGPTSACENTRPLSLTQFLRFLC